MFTSWLPMIAPVTTFSVDDSVEVDPVKSTSLEQLCVNNAIAMKAIIAFTLKDEDRIIGYWFFCYWIIQICKAEKAEKIRMTLTGLK